MGFGANLRRLREAKGLSVADIARALEHAGSTTVYRWESSPDAPNGDTLVRIATVLQASVEELMRGIYPEYDAMRAAQSAADVPGLTATEKTLLAQLRAIGALRPQEAEAYLSWFRFRLAGLAENPDVMEAATVEPGFREWCELYGSLSAAERTDALMILRRTPPAEPAKQKKTRNGNG